MKCLSKRFTPVFLICLFVLQAKAQTIYIENDAISKEITFGNSKMKLTLNYDHQCVLTHCSVNGQEVISRAGGIFTELRSSETSFSSRSLERDPVIRIKEGRFEIDKINYGPEQAGIKETWLFHISDTNIRFSIKRTVRQPLVLHEAGFPSFQFDRIDTWDGAFLGHGGLAWFYLFNQPDCTYGVHTNQSVFWNADTGNAMKINVQAPGQTVAMKYSRSDKDQLIYQVTVAANEMNPRYEKEKRSRFIRGKTDVWDDFTLAPGKYSQTVTLSYVDYHETYGRGDLVGLNGQEVSQLLNTVARIGVIDRNLFGGNSWHTPYGPICLHEQYIAQFAIGINDPAYVSGYQQCLDYYRDHAIQPDGRVIARWAYLDEDAIPGTVNEWGFYEAQWGYLMDSNADFVANVAQVFDLTGDLGWVAGHKETCERALDYLLRRDSNGNHLVEMMTNSQTERRGSDWIDIIWASFENAFVNAKLYYALTLWSRVEALLNDEVKAADYARYAAALKTSFNRPTEEGGFWDSHNQWYIHWREPDQSIHGDNLVVPVNFMAIVYGICDDTLRSHAILDKIEEQTAHEQLFFWPISIFPYAWGEGNDWQFPFPNYENGDIFLSWGCVGVEAYANYKPGLALKYVENVLDRYAQDGLAFQRYGRVNQDGRGDDILAGNSLAIVGLYKAIYGINPLYNRLYLNPHLPEKLAGTRLRYHYQGQRLEIGLSTGRYSIADEQFKVVSNRDFGFDSKKNELSFYAGNAEDISLKLQTKARIELEVLDWNTDQYRWKESSFESLGDINYHLKVARPNSIYQISYGEEQLEGESNSLGMLDFTLKSGLQNRTIIVTTIN
ncbi:MAG: hypothetical protein R2806_09960 [Saprospiraceae bacterium]